MLLNTGKHYCYPLFLASSFQALTLPQDRLEDIKRSIVLPPSQDIQFVVKETNAVSESGWLRELGKWPPLDASDQTRSTIELLSEPQGWAWNPLHEFIIHCVSADQDQDLNPSKPKYSSKHCKANTGKSRIRLNFF